MEPYVYCGEPPVEYAVAVDLFLAAAGLSDASARVYRIALTTWAWPLAGHPVPAGRARAAASPPVVPLALLEQPAAAERLRRAARARAAVVGPATSQREAVIWRRASGWWRQQGWIGAAPALPAPNRPPAPAEPLRAEQVEAVFRLRVPLREQTCWRLLYESGARIGAVLALDVDDVDLAARRTRPGQAALHWGTLTAATLPLLLAGRIGGPLFVGERRRSSADRCPVSGRPRLSYRRAAELFTEATATLDPAGHGWRLGQLRGASA